MYLYFITYKIKLYKIWIEYQQTNFILYIFMAEFWICFNF